MPRQTSEASPPGVKAKLSVLIPNEVDIALRRFGVDNRLRPGDAATVALCHFLRLDPSRFGLDSRGAARPKARRA
jgi:hypothetical protein